MRARIWKIASPVILLLAGASTCWGGQVVTDDTREWAKKVVEEKALSTVPCCQNTVAVLYYNNRTGQPDLDPLQKGLALMLITDLSHVSGVQVVERIKLQALMEEMGMGASGVVDPSSAPNVGKLLSARFVTGGDISGNQATLEVKGPVVDIPAATLLGEPAAQKSLDDFFVLEKDLLFQIIRLLKIELTPEEEERLRIPCSTNRDALLSLFKGVNFSDQQQYEKAAELYEKAMEDDPKICIAGDALTQLRELGLVREEPRTSALLQSLRDLTSLTNQLAPKEELRYTLTPKDVSTATTIDIVFPTKR